MSAAGDPYPGEEPLLEQATPACFEVFVAFVGRPIEASAYDTAAVAPNRLDWADAHRQAVCLVFARDCRFLDHQARGSGE